jgi:hypothetical protein
LEPLFEKKLALILAILGSNPNLRVEEGDLLKDPKLRTIVF